MGIVYKKIILAIDDSIQSIRAIEKVIDIQKNWNCRVVMIHSIQHHAMNVLVGVILPSTSGTHYVTEQELFYEYKKVGEDLLENRQELFENKGLSVETRLITEESPEKYIERIVEDEGFDLVVIGTKGMHSKFQQLFLGSVAQRVLKYANCDVLIIR